MPGGVADRDGRLLPGDRLMFVNETDLEGFSLDYAVHALKSTGYGPVRIGVAKPLPVCEAIFNDDTTDSVDAVGFITRETFTQNEKRNVTTIMHAAAFMCGELRNPSQIDD